MKSYNQFCPVAKAAELFCERWTARSAATQAPMVVSERRWALRAMPDASGQAVRHLRQHDAVRSSGSGEVTSP
jgi:hypothetical protein